MTMKTAFLGDHGSKFGDSKMLITGIMSADETGEWNSSLGSNSTYLPINDTDIAPIGKRPSSAPCTLGRPDSMLQTLVVKMNLRIVVIVS